MPVLRFFYNIYAAILFVVLMLLVFPLVIIASFFGKITGGNIIYKLCNFWADAWFALVFIRIKKIHDKPHDESKKYIIVANHISYLDIPVFVKIFKKPLRALGKVEMAKVPIFGFIYKNAIVTVDRSDAQHRARSLKILRSVLQKGISIFVFPEGTFNESPQPLKDFYNGAFRLAIETQTPIKPVIFLDTYDRMPYHFLLSLNPGRCRVVYLDEIAVEGMALTDMEQLKRKVYDAMQEKLIAYKASWIKDNSIKH